MAHGHNFLLFWFNISRFRVPPILLVRIVNSFPRYTAKVPSLFVACDTAACLKNRLLLTKKQIISGFSFYHP